MKVLVGLIILAAIGVIIKKTLLKKDMTNNSSSNGSGTGSGKGSGGSTAGSGNGMGMEWSREGQWIGQGIGLWIGQGIGLWNGLWLYNGYGMAMELAMERLWNFELSFFV